jgi:hypothetical protein
MAKKRGAGDQKKALAGGSERKPAWGTTLVQFRAGGLEGALASRGGGAAGLTARRDLGRYYDLLNEALAATRITHFGLLFLADACEGLAWTGAADFREKAAAAVVVLAEKHAGEARRANEIITFLDDAPAVEVLALADAVERIHRDRAAILGMPVRGKPADRNLMRFMRARRPWACGVVGRPAVRRGGVPTVRR